MPRYFWIAVRVAILAAENSPQPAPPTCCADCCHPANYAIPLPPPPPLPLVTVEMAAFFREQPDQN